LRSFDHCHDVQDIEDQDDFFHQKLSPFLQDKQSTDSKKSSSNGSGKLGKTFFTINEEKSENEHSHIISNKVLDQTLPMIYSPIPSVNS